MSRVNLGVYTKIKFHLLILIVEDESFQARFVTLQYNTYRDCTAYIGLSFDNMFDT